MQDAQSGHSGMLSDLQMELAARKYCELSGLDPDTTQWSGTLRIPLWQQIAERLRVREMELRVLELASKAT
jgi:hypothetical protein